MNDQIAKTLNQPAFDRLKDWYDIGPVQKATLELFAELIVRECIDIAGKEDFDVMMKEGYPCSQTAKKIKQHFGVEE